MPPIGMFRARSRPKGMEFAACAACNSDTRGADLVASFVARFGQEDDLNSWTLQENLRSRRMMAMRAPGVLEEIFDDRTTQNVLVARPSGLLEQKVVTRVSGPLTRGYLNVFSAKFAMALYREHIGEPLPLDGRIETIWFLNAGLSEETAQAMLSILPMNNTLTQGKFSVPKQFSYRYNTDGKEIVAALAGFHNNFHIFVLSSSNPIYEGLEEIPSHKSRPGQLTEMLPNRRILLPGLSSIPFSSKA